MKEIIKVFFISIVVSFSTSSCSHDEDVVYSCNESIDNWVKSHLNEIRSISREQWLDVDPELATPMYVAFTPQQKQKFWLQKFNEVLQLEWNNE